MKKFCSNYLLLFFCILTLTIGFFFYYKITYINKNSYFQKKNLELKTIKTGLNEEIELIPIADNGYCGIDNETYCKEIKNVLQNFVKSQYDYIIGKDKIPQWDQYLSLIIKRKLSNQLKNDIDNMLLNMKNGERKMTILGYESNLSEDEETKIRDLGNGLLEIDGVRDNYILKDSFGFFSNHYQTQSYKFIMKKEKGDWKIYSRIEYSNLGKTEREKGAMRWIYNEGDFDLKYIKDKQYIIDKTE